MKRKGLVLAVVVAAMFAAIGLGAKTTLAVAPPVANTGGPYLGVIGAPVTFNGALSTGIGLTFQWTFGDGTTGSGVIVGHTYTAGGTYTVTLTVIDAYSQVASDVTTVTVGGIVRYGANGCFFNGLNWICNGAVVTSSFALNSLCPVYNPSNPYCGYFYPGYYGWYASYYPWGVPVTAWCANTQSVIYKTNQWVCVP